MSFLFDLSLQEKSVEFCLDLALKVKQTEVKPTTYKDYKSKFKKFLSKHN